MSESSSIFSCAEFGTFRNEGEGTWVDWYWRSTDILRIRQLKTEAVNRLTQYQTVLPELTDSNDGASIAIIISYHCCITVIE